MKFTIEAFRQPSRGQLVEPLAMGASSVPEAFSPAPPGVPPSGWTQPHGNAGLNGRLDALLGDASGLIWTPRFEVPLFPDARPHSVMQAGDAVAVQARVLQVFGLDGTPRFIRSAGSSPAALGATDGTLRYVNGDGYLTAVRLADGRELWTRMSHFGDDAEYPFLTAEGARTILVGSERDMNPEADPMPFCLSFEVLEPGRPTSAALGGDAVRVDADGDEGERGDQEEERAPPVAAGALVAERDGQVFAARSGDTVLIAWQDMLATVSLDLQVRRLLTAAFTPLALSADEAGRAYLIVRTEEGPALWLVNAVGERVFDEALPDDGGVVHTPPLVAPDHRVFVVTQKRVIAFSPAGEFLWEFVPPSGRPYASVTADGWLLVSVDRSVGLLDGYGRGKALYTSSGEAFCTAPVLTPNGEILVASEGSLLCLEFEEVGSRTVVR